MNMIEVVSPTQAAHDQFSYLNMEFSQQRQDNKLAESIFNNLVNVASYDSLPRSSKCSERNSARGQPEHRAIEVLGQNRQFANQMITVEERYSSRSSKEKSPRDGQQPMTPNAAGKSGCPNCLQLLVRGMSTSRCAVCQLNGQAGKSRKENQ